MGTYLKMIVKKAYQAKTFPPFLDIQRNSLDIQP